MAWLLGLVLLGACSHARAPDHPPLQVPPPPIRELQLPNGLRVFVVERHSAPTFAAVYSFDVGASEDPRGRSGIAHLLEHLMFKGTRELGSLDPAKEAALAARLDTLWHALDAERDPLRRSPQRALAERVARLQEQIAEVTAEYRRLIVRDEFDELLARAGAENLNAATTEDATIYQMELPANRLELWFRLERDRLLQPMFREFYTERDVVRAERRRNHDNLADSLLYDALFSMMFAAHPYGTPIIGWPGDIEHLQREDALAYFRSHYTPDRCTLVLVGDVQTAEVARLASKYLGAWPRSKEPAVRFTTPEPEQDGERRRVVEFDAAPRLMLGWTTVSEQHADRYPLEVLGRVLGGMSHSRLSRGLGGGIAWHAAMASGGYFIAAANPGEWRFIARYQEARLLRAIRNIQRGGITAVELARAKLDLQNQNLPGLDDDLPLARRIARAVSHTGSVEPLTEYSARIAAVTAEQVRDVARRYLREERKCVAELRRPARRSTHTEAAPAAASAKPEAESADAAKPEPSQHSAAFVTALSQLRAAPPIAVSRPQVGRDVERLVLPSGITLYLQEDHSRPTVSLSFAWRGGVNSAPLSDLDAFPMADAMLSSSGTSSLTPEQVRERKHELGMRFNLWLGGTLCQASLYSPSQTFASSYDLALDILFHPRLGEWSMWGAKFAQAAAMKARGETLGTGASEVLRHILDGSHPRLGYVPGKWRLLLTTWPYHVRRLWRRYLGRDNLYITAVGDFDRQELIARIERTLGRWRPAQDARRVDLVRPPVVAPGAYLLRSAHSGVAVGLAQHLPIDRTAPEAEHAALRVLSGVLFDSGMQSVFLNRLRVREGLTYTVSSALEHEGRPGVPGLFRFGFQVQTGQAYRAINAALQELDKLRRQELPRAVLDELLESRRNHLSFDYSDRATNVNRLLSFELDERPPDHDRRQLEAEEQVTPADVLRVAQKYLRPEHLTIALFGTLSAEEEAQIKKRFGLKVLPAKAVFKGGYD